MKTRVLRWAWMRGWLFVLLLAVAGLAVGVGQARASDATEAQGIVDRAKATVNDFMADSNYSWLHEHLKTAKGVLIFPQVIKGGFFIGGSGGTGVLLVRDAATGTWSQPAFYTLGSVSFGLQIGGEAAEVMMLVTNQRALDSLYSSSVKLGGDISLSVGPYGAGAKGAVNVNSYFISFAKTKGLYAGLNLDGSVLEVRDSLNHAYYGKKLTPLQIIVEKKGANPDAAGLLAALEKSGK